MKSGTLAVLWLSSLLIPAPVSAATWEVPAQCATIQAGIDSASAGDTVLVACGTYYEHDIVMKSGVSLRSASGDPACVTIDARQQGRVVYCDSMNASTRIEGLTLTGGVATAESEPPYEGGAVHCDGSEIAFVGCEFRTNSAAYGGGVSCWGGSQRFVHCRFFDNASECGGALVCWNSTASISECMFTENSAGGAMAGEGGAVSCYDSSPSLVDCVFSENMNSNGWGSAFSCWGGSPILVHCVFAMNSGSADCGAVASHFSTPCLTGCTFVGNRAGAIFAGSGSAPVLERTVVAFGVEAEAVQCYDASSAVTLACCNIYGNVGGDWVGCIADQHGVDGNFSQDPLFCDPENGDFDIQCGSPCAPGYHPDGHDCGLIGALGVGCGGSSSERRTWGGVKSLYR